MGNIKIEPVPKNSFVALGHDISQTLEKQPSIVRLARLSAEVPPNLAEDLKDYSHQKGMTQKEAITHILETYFRENRPEQRPKEVRERAEQRMAKKKVRRR